MKKTTVLQWYVHILLHLHLSTFGLLRDRTVARYEKQNLTKLLDEMGVETIFEAQEQIRGIQDLLISLEAYTIQEAQENLQALFNFIAEIEDRFQVQDINQVIEEIDSLQSLRAHIASFDRKK